MLNKLITSTIGTRLTCECKVVVKLLYNNSVVLLHIRPIYIGINKMSESHQYLSKNNTSFFSVDDDVDDEEFLRHPPSGRCNMLDGANVTENVPSRNLQDFHQEQLHKRREIQNRMVETSQRSLSVLRDTEEIGVSTAEVRPSYVKLIMGM